MSKGKIKFAMGIHNHQPVGNFDWVFDEAYNKAYLPIMECLERHPAARIALHFTGPLWDAYLSGKPEWIKKLRSLVKSGQVEMLSGAYYEPILINIPDRDKIAQIKKMNRVVKRETGARPRGMWCAERVWEPGLARPIALSDVEYTVLDEAHFRSAGLEEKDVFGYYVTEEQGHPLAVIPINYKLRRMIPYCPPEDVINYLEAWADESGERLGVFADDGEKFGLWPSTFRIVWEERWMDRLFDLIQKNSDWIEMVTFSEYMDRHKPIGRVYLPTASYFEMSTWALPTARGRAFRNAINEASSAGSFEEDNTFMRGGFWRNFLVKYPQSNRIQKKALHVSEKVQRMVGRDKALAEEELHKGQCNCAYWHGVFGGIYLPHLRHAIQESLIVAEHLADEEFHRGEPYKDVALIDIDKDLSQEVIINTKNLQLSFSPLLGGALYEMDFKPMAVNLCDTLTRKEEIYHDEVRPPYQPQAEPAANETAEGDQSSAGLQLCPKEEDLTQFLIYDKYQRNSFIDHFLEKDATPESFWRGQHKELGDFVEKPYEVFTSTKDDKAVLTLSRKGSVEQNGVRHKVEIEKTFFVPEDGFGFTASYWLINNSDEDLDLKFACELDFSFLSKDPGTNHIVMKWEEEIEADEEEAVVQTETAPFTQMGRQEGPEEITLRDGHRGYQVNINLGMKGEVWHFPIETVCKKLDGFERVYQSTVIMPAWNVKLEPGDTWDNAMEIRIREIGSIREGGDPSEEEILKAVS